MRSRTVCVIVAVLAIASGCARGPEVESPPPKRAFYFWRTTFALAPAEQQALAALHVERIYLRMFDVAWSETEQLAMPIGKVVPGTGVTLPAGVELVPVIYVKVEIFKHVAKEGLPALARRLWTDVQERAGAIGFQPRELQLDCDWTESTREAFFTLVRELRAASGVPLSATIRLHQVKYRERTGVPPVERGMLMFYNMGRFSADPDARAIFDGVSAAKYLARLDQYPLPLDVALPIWSWTVHVRDERVEGLLQSTDPAELPALDFLVPAGPNQYRVTRTTFLHGTLLREDDILKIEVTGPAETQAAAAMLKPHLPPVARTLTLFDLSERNLTRHGTDQLESTFRALR